jgi:glycosyltransferase involved in cell wall biosynthesis
MIPTLSIIVPVYKAETYLENCINSILDQSYSDFELVLVDDGSPDQCGAICDAYAQTDERIKVIHKENGGASSARNVGIDIAQGVYIGFVDSDDYIDKNMYEILLNNLKLYDADISECKLLMVNDFTTKATHKSEQIKVFNNIDALHNLYNGNYTNTVVLWNKIYKKSLFDEIRFPLGKIHEDDFTTHKLLYKAQKIVNTDAALYCYFRSSNSVMRKQFNLKRLDALEAFKQRKTFFKQEKLTDLYDKACESYGDLLIMYYTNVQNEIIDNDFTLKLMKRDFRKFLAEMIEENNLSTKTLTRFVLFDMLPEN